MAVTLFVAVIFGILPHHPHTSENDYFTLIKWRRPEAKRPYFEVIWEGGGDGEWGKGAQRFTVTIPGGASYCSYKIKWYSKG